MKPYIYTIISSILLFGCTPEPLTPEQQKAYVETNSKCETDNYKASDHVKIINSYLNKKKINIILANTGAITKAMKEKYASLEQKDPVIFDKKNLKNMQIKIIFDDFVAISDGALRHDITKLGFHIYSYLILGR